MFSKQNADYNADKMQSSKEFPALKAEISALTQNPVHCDHQLKFCINAKWMQKEMQWNACIDADERLH